MATYYIRLSSSSRRLVKKLIYRLSFRICGLKIFGAHLRCAFLRLYYPSRFRDFIDRINSNSRYEPALIINFYRASNYW
jgi:hypothetical protein